MKKHNPECRISDVANYFVHFGQKHGDPPTHLKLQKLCYYAEAYYWAIHDKPLTGEPFEAWTHGPVSRKLWDIHKGRSWDPIIAPCEKPKFPPAVESYLKEVAEVFYKFSAFDLEKMTHHDDPWRNARKGVPIEAKCENVISTTDMKSYYKKYLKNA